MPESTAQSIAISFLVPAVVGLVAWVWALWLRHHDLDKKVAEFYPKREELAAVNARVEARLVRIEDAVIRLCLKMEVPVVTEFTR